MADTSAVKLQDVPYTPSRETMANIKFGINNTAEGVKSTKIILIVSSLICVALLGVNFGLSVAANSVEWSKHEGSESTLVSSKGETLNTGAAALAQKVHPAMKADDLNALTSVSVPIGASDVSLKVDGYYFQPKTKCSKESPELCGAPDLVLLTPHGNIVYDGNSAEPKIELKSDSPLKALMDEASSTPVGRHLLQEREKKNKMPYNSGVFNRRPVWNRYCQDCSVVCGGQQCTCAGGNQIQCSVLREVDDTCHCGCPAWSN